MLFHTWTFLLFFLVVMGGFFALRRSRFWLHWLMLASYVFYGWWNPYYLILILYSTALDYWVVQWMDRCPDRRAPGYLESRKTGFFGSRLVWLWVSIVNNLSLLFFFKYANFFIANLNWTFHLLGATWHLPSADRLMPFDLDYLLPVGISFFTFQSMSYTIDFYYGKIHRERSFIKFATFVSFFPQLVAGPIERAKNLLPQFNQFPKVTRQDVTDGLSLFLVGLFKKLALANYLSFYVERIYEDPSRFNSAALLLGTFAFAWQIYFDFSGYTDMARGIARTMGFRLMLNFNHPYLATSLGDFWGRWHISLSTWFRDYVYVPMGGNRNGTFNLYRNLLITFVISGFWHGAAWTFVVWGGLHAFGTMATRALEATSWYRDRVPRFVKQLAVFMFVCFAWIFFRADSMSDAWLIITRIASTGWASPDMPILMILMICAVWIYQWLNESSVRRWLEHSSVRIGTGIAMILYMFLFSTGGGEFIYFQF